MEENDTTPWLDDAESRAWRGHVQVSQLLAAQLERDLIETAGLSHPDYGVLVTLSEDPAGRVRMSEVALRLAWSKSRLSHQVSRMEKRGLVQRSSCGDDGRGAWLGITPEGMVAIQSAAPSHVASVRRHLLDHLTPQQVRQLGDICDVLLGHLRSEVGVVPDHADRSAAECDSVSLEPSES